MNTVTRPSDATLAALRNAGYSTFFSSRDSVLEVSRGTYREWFDMNLASSEWLLGELVDELHEMALYRATSGGSYALVHAAA